MNVYTVRLVTQAQYLKVQGRKGVAIAHDSRHMSREFTEAAAVSWWPTASRSMCFPMWPLRRFCPSLSACSGSCGDSDYRQPQSSGYNGYKVYNERGNQMLAEEALSISSQMAELGLDSVLADPNPQENLFWNSLGDEVLEAYYQKLLEIAPKVENAENLRIVYTPLHGTGGRYVTDILQQAGFSQVAAVPEQLEPDGNFPTVSFPNPEDPEAFKLAFAQAGQTPCDLIIATDPDADRMGVAVPQKGKCVLLNGNQVGVLLADFLLARLAPGQAALCGQDHCHHRMVQSVAAKYGAEVKPSPGSSTSAPSWMSCRREQRICLWL